MKQQADNRIGDLGGEMISEVLKSNRSLTELDLCGDVMDLKELK